MEEENELIHILDSIYIYLIAVLNNSLSRVERK